MAKNEFARGTLTFNLTEYGIFDISLDFTYSEIDTTDTLTAAGQSELLGGKQTINVSFTMYKDAGSADLILNRTAALVAVDTALTSGIAYRLTDWITDDDFTNVGAGSNADGVEFIATGTTPTHFEHSEVHTMVECTLKVEDGAGNYTTYEGDLIILTKNVTGNIDGAVQLAYTGKITGAITETQG